MAIQPRATSALCRSLYEELEQAWCISSDFQNGSIIGVGALPVAELVVDEPVRLSWSSEISPTSQRAPEGNIPSGA